MIRREAVGVYTCVRAHFCLFLCASVILRACVRTLPSSMPLRTNARARIYTQTGRQEDRERNEERQREDVNEERQREEVNEARQREEVNEERQREDVGETSTSSDVLILQSLAFSKISLDTNSRPFLMPNIATQKCKIVGTNNDPAHLQVPLRSSARATVFAPLLSPP